MYKLEAHYKREFLYLIMDRENDIILTATHSQRTAKSVCLSTRRLYSYPMEQWANHIDKSFKTINFKVSSTPLHRIVNPSFHVDKGSSSQGRTCELVDESTITEEYKKFRANIHLLLHAHDNLSNLSDLMMENYILDNYYVEYSSSIIYELDKCHPEKEFYSDAVCSYAAITGISPWGAYQELRMTMDNLSHARLRVLAIYIKYRNMLNSVPLLEKNIRDVLELCRFEMFKGSLL